MACLVVLSFVISRVCEQGQIIICPYSASARRDSLPGEKLEKDSERESVGQNVAAKGECP